METDEKNCPFCAETIKAAAITCKHCGRDIDSFQERKTSMTKQLPEIVVGVSLRPLISVIIWAIIVAVLGGMLMSSAETGTGGKSITGGILYGLIVVLIGGIYVVANAIGTRITITNDEVIYKRGILSFHSTEIHLAKLERIELSKGVIGNLFGYGRLVLGGGGKEQTRTPQINNPDSVRKEILSRVESIRGK